MARTWGNYQEFLEMHPERYVYTPQGIRQITREQTEKMFPPIYERVKIQIMNKEWILKLKSIVNKERKMFKKWKRQNEINHNNWQSDSKRDEKLWKLEKEVEILKAELDRLKMTSFKYSYKYFYKGCYDEEVQKYKNNGYEYVGTLEGLDYYINRKA